MEQIGQGRWAVSSRVSRKKLAMRTARKSLDSNEARLCCWNRDKTERRASPLWKEGPFEKNEPANIEAEASESGDGQQETRETNQSTKNNEE
jgi:hypothetical protein